MVQKVARGWRIVNVFYNLVIQGRRGGVSLYSRSRPWQAGDSPIASALGARAIDDLSVEGTAETFPTSSAHRKPGAQGNALVASSSIGLGDLEIEHGLPYRLILGFDRLPSLLLIGCPQARAFAGCAVHALELAASNFAGIGWPLPRMTIFVCPFGPCFSH